MLDFDTLVLGPVYETFGSPAALSIGPLTYDLVVVDYTKGVSVDDDGTVGIQTIRPAADVRRGALATAGIALDDLIGAEVELAGTNWRIKSLIESEAEVRLILLQAGWTNAKQSWRVSSRSQATWLESKRPSATRMKFPNALVRQSSFSTHTHLGHGRSMEGSMSVHLAFGYVLRARPALT